MSGLSTVAIEGVVRRKVDQWLASITDKELAAYLKDKVIVSGGAIASLLLGENVNDFDVYFTERAAAVRAANYYMAIMAKNPPRQWTGAPVRMFIDPAVTDRVKIVIKSVGVAGEQGDDGTYQYFETTRGTEAADYVENVTSRAFRAQARDTDSAPDVTQPEAFEQAVNEVLAGSEAPAEKGCKAKNAYRPVFMSGNAITLSDSVQLIVRFFGKPEEIHANFDFIHCTNYWYRDSDGTGAIYVNSDALVSLLSKKLKYVGSRYPLCSLIRTRKFVGRGWSAPASVYIKAMHQCLSLDWNKLETWQEQLTGVDSAYFAEILAILAKEQAEGKTLDAAYVVALIDKLL